MPDTPLPAEPETKAEAPQPKLPPPEVISQLKARYAVRTAFSTAGELKRLFLFVILGLSGVAMVGQFQWNRMKAAETIRLDNEREARRLEAIKAPPQPGAGTGAENEVVKWDNMLAEEKDDAPIDDMVSDKGFKYIVRHISNLKPGEGLKPEENFDYTDLLKNPALHRGNVVSLSLLVNKVYSYIRLESNQGPYDSVYRLYLVDLAGKQGAIVDVLDRPDGIAERNAVECDAVFVRTMKYETDKADKEGSKIRRVPYFVAQKVTKVPRAASATMWTPTVTVTVVAACAVLVAGIFLVGRTSRPKQQTIQVSSNAL